MTGICCCIASRSQRFGEFGLQGTAAHYLYLGGTDEAFQTYTDQLGIVAAPQATNVIQPFFRWVSSNSSVRRVGYCWRSFTCCFILYLVYTQV
jgi:hypothetical protein